RDEEVPRPAAEDRDQDAAGHLGIAEGEGPILPEEDEGDGEGGEERDRERGEVAAEPVGEPAPGQDQEEGRPRQVGGDAHPEERQDEADPHARSPDGAAVPRESAARPAAAEADRPGAGGSPVAAAEDGGGHTARAEAPSPAA